MTTPTVVWTEIPVTNLEASAAFYADVFGWKMEIAAMGPNDAAVFNGETQSIAGHLYAGSPAKDGGAVIHLALPGSLEEGITRCEAAGGQITSPEIEVPPGRYVYAKDLDGNTLGLFEPKAA